MWDLFKVNLSLTFNIYRTFSTVSIVEFEQLNACKRYILRYEVNLKHDIKIFWILEN